MGEDKGTALPGNVVRIDEERIKDHLGRIVRGPARGGALRRGAVAREARLHRPRRPRHRRAQGNRRLTGTLRAD